MTTTARQLKEAIAYEIGEVPDSGRILLFDKPIHDWQQFLSQFGTTSPNQVRAWVVLYGKPLCVTQPMAAGYDEDVYTFKLWGFEGSGPDEGAQEAAYERAMAVRERLLALDPPVLESGDEVILPVGPFAINAHEFRTKGGVGLWFTDATFRVNVARLRP